MIKLLLLGFLLLIGAILLNVLANAFGIMTWYTYLNQMASLGFWQATKTAGLLSLVWLYLVYPLALGYLVHYSNLLLELISFL